MGTVNKTTANINNILNLANGYVAAPFSSATTYKVGDYCSRSGKVYRCKTAGASAWSSSRWTEVVLGDEVTGINTDIALTSGASSSVSNNSWTLLQTLSVSAGLYLVNYGCSWGGSATGYRQLGLSGQPERTRRSDSVSRTGNERSRDINERCQNLEVHSRRDAVHLGKPEQRRSIDRVAVD